MRITNELVRRYTCITLDFLMVRLKSREGLLMRSIYHYPPFVCHVFPSAIYL